MKKVAVIGAGIFGLQAALELSKFCKVKVFERKGLIIPEATSQNMYRHHMGYHYPRSDSTVKEIKDASKSFEEEYSECLVKDFPAYYSVAKEDSMLTKEQVIAFMDRNNLPYEIINPPDWLIDKNKITVCFKTPEAVYDPFLLRGLLVEKIKDKIEVFVNHEVIGGNKDTKTLKIKNNDNEFEESFDIIVNATYSHFNTFNKWFGFPMQEVQYDLMELLELKLPLKEKFGMLILDGLFCTILPIGEQGTFVLGHVKHTMLKRLVAKEMEEIHNNRQIESNRDVILKESAKWMPFLKDAKIVKSMYSTRVIKPHREHDDARPTEITVYGDGFYSIFAGKVITAVKTARELAEKIKNE